MYLLLALRNPLHPTVFKNSTVNTLFEPIMIFVPKNIFYAPLGWIPRNLKFWVGDVDDQFHIEKIANIIISFRTLDFLLFVWIQSWS